MIDIILFSYALYAVLVALAKPSVRAYYEEKYGKTWESIGSDLVFLGPEDYFMLMVLMPFILPFAGLFEAYERAILPALSYPGKRLARNLKVEEEKRQLPAHDVTIMEEAEKEVEEFLKKP